MQVNYWVDPAFGEAFYNSCKASGSTRTSIWVQRAVLPIALCEASRLFEGAPRQLCLLAAVLAGSCCRPALDLGPWCKALKTLVFRGRTDLCHIRPANHTPEQMHSK